MAKGAEFYLGYKHVETDAAVDHFDFRQSADGGLPPPVYYDHEPDVIGLFGEASKDILLLDVSPLSVDADDASLPDTITITIEPGMFDY